MDEIYSIKTKFIPSPYVIFTYYANVREHTAALPPPSISLSHPFLIIALEDTTCTNRSRVVPFFTEEVFPSKRIPFLREIENTRRNGMEFWPRRDTTARTVMQMSRVSASFYDAGRHTRVSTKRHKCAEDIHFNKQISEMEGYAGCSFRRGTRSRATGVLLFAGAV